MVPKRVESQNARWLRISGQVASCIPHINHYSLVQIATTPGRVVVNRNERILAAEQIVKDGIQSDDEVEPFLALLKDEYNYPLITGTTNEKANYAILRGDAALVLAKYGLKTEEFIDTLKQILTSILDDPVFVPHDDRGSTMFFNKFLAALYLADNEGAMPLVLAFTTEDQIKAFLT